MPFDATPSTPSTPLTLPPILTHRECSALLRVRDDLRSGHIRNWQFNMRKYGGPHCGCIAGHAIQYMSEFTDRVTYIRNPKYNGLFALGFAESHPAYNATPAQGAEAIDNFLTTGNPQWFRIMGME